jgi:hypothetical protein
MSAESILTLASESVRFVIRPISSKLISLPRKRVTRAGVAGRHGAIRRSFAGAGDIWSFAAMIARLRAAWTSSTIWRRNSGAPGLCTARAIINLEHPLQPFLRCPAAIAGDASSPFTASLAQRIWPTSDRFHFATAAGSGFLFPTLPRRRGTIWSFQEMCWGR